MKEPKSPFRGLKDEIIEMNVGKSKIKVKPVVGDIEAFLTMKKEMTPEDASRVTKALVDMIHRVNPNEDREDIESYVARNYVEVLTQFSIISGLSTPEQMKEAKKKLMEKET